MGNSATPRIVAIPELKYFSAQMFADMLESPNNVNWAVNGIAALEADAVNNALATRAFDDMTEEGVGFSIYVPDYARSMALRFFSRAKVAPGSAKVVTPRLYMRGVPDNAAVESWSAAYDLTNIDIPTNAYFQRDTQIITLSALGMTTDRVYQIELTRKTMGVSGNLTGDWVLLSLEVGFTV